MPVKRWQSAWPQLGLYFCVALAPFLSLRSFENGFGLIAAPPEILVEKRIHRRKNSCSESSWLGGVGFISRYFLTVPIHRDLEEFHKYLKRINFYLNKNLFWWRCQWTWTHLFFNPYEQDVWGSPIEPIWYHYTHQIFYGSNSIEIVKYHAHAYHDGNAPHYFFATIFPIPSNELFWFVWRFYFRNKQLLLKNGTTMLNIISFFPFLHLSFYWPLSPPDSSVNVTWARGWINPSVGLANKRRHTLVCFHRTISLPISTFKRIFRTGIYPVLFPLMLSSSIDYQQSWWHRIW